MSRLEQLQKFLEQDPNDSLTRYMIALEFAALKKFPDAIVAFEELRSRDTAYVATYYQLADCYRQQGETQKAEEVYRSGILEARKANDLHAASELQMAFDEMESE